jgi:hypothetical protein
VCQLEQGGTYGLVEFDSLAEGYKNNGVVLQSHHNALLIIKQRFHGGMAQATGINPVNGTGRTSPLQVTKNGNPHVIIPEVILNLVGNGYGTSLFISFGNNDYVA